MDWPEVEEGDEEILEESHVALEPVDKALEQAGRIQNVPVVDISQLEDYKN